MASEPRRIDLATPSAFVRASLAAVVALASALATCGVMTRHLDCFDEGILATDSYLVTRGLVPYRDFYCIYGFGELYVGAALLKVLGHTLTAVRLIRFGAHVAVVTLAFLVAWRIGRSRLLAFATAILITGLLGSNGDLALAVSLMSLPFGATFLLRGDRRSLIASAAAAGLSAWMRPDTAIYTIVGWTIVLALCARRSGEQRASAVRSPAFVFAAVAIAVAAFGYLPFAAVASVDLWHGIVQVPTQSMPARHLPHPAITEAFFTRYWVHIVVFAGVGLFLIRDLVRNGRTLDAVGGTAAAACIQGVLHLIYAMGRSDELHQIPSLVFACILLPWLVRRLWEMPQASAGRVLAVATAFYACVSVIKLDEVRMLYAMDRSLLQQSWSGRGAFGLATIQADDPRPAAVQYVRDHSAPDSRLYVGLERTDRVFINDVLFYFLAQRLPAVHDHQFDPLIATTPEAQQRMIADLERTRPPLAVLWRGLTEEADTHARPVPDGANLIDLYVRQQYRPAATFGDYLVCERIER